MIRTICRVYTLIGLLLAIYAIPTAALAQGVTVAERGQARCVIIAPAGMMAWDGDARSLGGWRDANRPEIIQERGRRLQRDSVRDLARCLEKITGAKIEILDAVPANDARTPIYIGDAAQAVFGPVGITKAGQYGFRVVADRRKGIGLFGESTFGTSYAIYELLHRLGCRWYMPSAMGEVIPSQPTVTVAEMDLKLAPATELRAMWGRTGDEDFFRRNRLNGTGLSSGHALSLNLKYWDEQEANRIADGIIAQLDKTYVTTVSLSPHDGVMPTEDPEGRKFDPEPRVWEPAASRWSTTDRVMMLANRVATRVGAKYPDVNFGLLAYVNFSQPPAREPVHPNVIPVIAPIDFNRHHPMDWPDHPNQYWLRDMVEGWAKKSPRWGYYAYGMNLAELTAPCPFITKWGSDLKIAMDNHLTYWMPETMGGWDSNLPGYYLSIRMTFYPDEKPDDILNEMWTKFYGPAAEPMGHYWRRIDRAWIEPKEYSGSLFGYLRIFTPEVMAEARGYLNQAQANCQPGSVELERVKLIDETFSLFELFMKMREDYAAARLQNLDADLNTWRTTLRALVAKYAAQKVLRGEPWSPGNAPGGMAEDYINQFVGHTYTDASRMDATYARVGTPMLQWKYQPNPGPEADALPWTAPAYNDADWTTAHVVRETWSTIGHHNTITDVPSGRSGRMVYRAAQRLDAVPAGKRVYLWIGATDGSAKLFVNGRHIKFTVPENAGPYFRRNKAGDVIDAFNGYCRPALFEITDAVKAGDNQFTVLCERTILNELGTGGLMGPVIVYRER